MPACSRTGAAGRAIGRPRRRGAEQHPDQGGGLDIGQFLPQLGQVAAGDMAGLVRHHADDLIRGRGVGKRTGIDEDASAVDDECVERPVVDQHDLDIGLAQSGGAEDRRSIVAHCRFRRRGSAARRRCAFAAGRVDRARPRSAPRSAAIGLGLPSR
jgi:hypothetical protein